MTDEPTTNSAAGGHTSPFHPRARGRFYILSESRSLPGDRLLQIR
jgi:hypothetical protein